MKSEQQIEQQIEQTVKNLRAALEAVDGPEAKDTARAAYYGAATALEWVLGSSREEEFVWEWWTMWAVFDACAAGL